MTAPLEGKKVLITGSSRGIGRATALAMARAGADVAIHYHRQADLANQVAEEIRGLGRDALVIAANLEDLTGIAWMCLWPTPPPRPLSDCPRSSPIMWNGRIG